MTSDSVPALRGVLGLEVILLKQVFVLPWNQFLYVEGGDEVRAVFTTHDVVAKGNGLALLLSDLAAQQVTTLKEPARAARFAHATATRFTELYVRKAEQIEPGGIMNVEKVATGGITAMKSRACPME